MPLTYSPSTEKIARSYQRTSRMVPNAGVSALTVVNPGRPVAAWLRAGKRGRTSRRLRGNSRLYHVVAINKRTGTVQYLTRTPETHERASTILRKQSIPRPYVKIALEEAHSAGVSPISRKLLSNRRRSTSRASRRNRSRRVTSRRSKSRRRVVSRRRP